MGTAALPALPAGGAPVAHTITDIREMAKAVADSRLFGLDAPQAMTLMLLAQAKGIHPIQAVERYHVIKGRPTMKADAMLADFQAAGGSVEWIERTTTAWEGIFRHPTHAPKGEAIRFTIEDARRAQLLGNEMWSKYPSNMLRARVISNAIRTVMPGIVAGIYTPEEAANMPPAIEASFRVSEPGTSAPAPEPPAPEPPAPEPPGRPAGRPETWAAWVAKTARRANDEWLNEIKMEGVEPAHQRDLVNQHQLVNHVCSAMIAANVMDAREVADPRSGKRDRTRALKEVSAYFGRYPEWVEAEVEDHLKELRHRGRTELGIFDPEASQEEPEPVAAPAGREPGQDG